MAASTTDPQFQPTLFYCEENVYMLCKKLCTSGIAKADGSDLFIVFISNEKKQVPIWHQRASNGDEVILWDYHVICFQRKSEGSSRNLQRKSEGSSHLVWDIDSTLTLPTPLGLYLSEAIRISLQLFSEYQRCFRIVHAPNFFRFFASDRRHMKDSNGNWVAEPPAHDPIVAEDGTVFNLHEYVTMKAADAVEHLGADSINSVFTQKHGVVVNESRLMEFLSLIT